MNGKDLKKVIENSGLPKGRLAAMMGVSYQAFAQYYRTTDLRQETLDRIDEAIRKMTDGKVSLYSCLSSLLQASPSSSESSDEESGQQPTDEGAVLCDPIPSVSAETIQAVTSPVAPGNPAGVALSECERNIVDVYARVISDVERMYKQLEREYSELHALKSDLQHIVASLRANSQQDDVIPMAAEPIAPRNAD